jgi:beta propeller repeat protein
MARSGFRAEQLRNIARYYPPLLLIATCLIAWAALRPGGGGRVVAASQLEASQLSAVRRYDSPLAADFAVSSLPFTSEEAPAIDRSKVIWYDDRTQGPTDVWGFDFAAAQEFQVTAHPVAQLLSDVGGDVVAYEDNRNGTWDIYATRLSTGVEFVVATGPNHQRYPRVWGDYIVYQDETSDYFYSDVYLYQISSGMTTALAVAPFYQGRPDIDDGWVVWTDWRDGNWQLAVHEIASGATTFRSIDCDDDCRPRIDGHEVVWNGWRSGNYDIYLLDLLTAEERTVYSAPGDQRYPALSDTLIAWQDEAAYGNWNVFVYVRADGTLFPVSIEPSRQQYPAVSGNIVVWQDNRNHTWDIYGLVWDGVAPPNPSTALRSPTELHVGAFPGGEIRLAWTDTVTNELGFVIQRTSGIFGVDWLDYATVPAGATSYVDTATVLGESYWYRIRAYNTDGASAYSNESYSTAFDSVPTADERYAHLLINDARMDPGAWGYPELAPVTPLGWDAALAYSAHAHALGMNNSNCCQGHVDLAARGPSERAFDSGYPYGVGENLFQAGAGPDGLESAHQGFMDSDGHRANIMAAGMKQTAVGFAPGGRGTLVQVFSGGPSSAETPALPSGIAVPYAGPVETEFNFLVTFWHPGLVAPTTAAVVIDGAPLPDDTA